MKYSIRSKVAVDGDYLLNFLNSPEGWDVAHTKIEVQGPEESPIFIYRIPYRSRVAGFECNEKMLDTFNGNITMEAYAQGWGINGIPYLFKVILREPRHIILIAEHFVFQF